MELEGANCKHRVSECQDIEQLSMDYPVKCDIEIDGLETLVQELHRVFSKSHVNIQEVQRLMSAYKSDPKQWRKYAKFDRFRYTRNLVDAGNGAFNIMILCWGPGHASAIHDHADSHCFMKLLSGSLDEVRYEWPDNVQPPVIKKLKTKSRTISETSQMTENMTNIDINENERCPNRCHNQNDCENRNGCENQRNGCENQRNGCEHQQNGFENQRNGFENQQNGFENQQNSYDNQRNGCESQQNRHDEEDYGYEVQSMKEIGRTRLEVDDVCYINDAQGLHRMENPSYVDGAVSLHLYCPPFDSCRVFDSRTGKSTEVQVTFWSMYGKKVKRVIEANPSDDQE